MCWSISSISISKWQQMIILKTKWSGFLLRLGYDGVEVPFKFTLLYGKERWIFLSLFMETFKKHKTKKSQINAKRNCECSFMTWHSTQYIIALDEKGADTFPLSENFDDEKHFVHRFKELLAKTGLKVFLFIFHRFLSSLSSICSSFCNVDIVAT